MQLLTPPIDFVHLCVQLFNVIHNFRRADLGFGAELSAQRLSRVFLVAMVAAVSMSVAFDTLYLRR